MTVELEPDETLVVENTDTVMTDSGLAWVYTSGTVDLGYETVTLTYNLSDEWWSL